MADNLSSEIRHKLDLVLSDDDLIAFMAVLIFDKSIDVTAYGDKEKKFMRRIVPLLIDLHSAKITAEERRELGSSLIALGEKIRNEAIESIK